jgi:hypothetical protein
MNGAIGLMDTLLVHPKSTHVMNYVAIAGRSSSRIVTTASNHSGDAGNVFPRRLVIVMHPTAEQKMDGVSNNGNIKRV